MAEEVKEQYLTISKRDTLEVVTVIEVLSPTNKRPSSYDRSMYLAERDEVLLNRTNLVELDLLRGGQRLPAEEDLAHEGYYVIVCRGIQRPRADAFHWSIREPMPTIPIP